jgi:hypothetical protein
MMHPLFFMFPVARELWNCNSKLFMKISPYDQT